ncbi:MAG: hypothetical protein U1E73_00255 [Planctomycetota bacterium]
MSRGVHSSASTEDNLQKDLADLRKCRDVAAVPVPGFGVADFASEPRAGEEEKWRRSLRFLSVEAGAFFVDENGRLSYYQFLRIDHAREFCRMADEAARVAWKEQREKAAKDTVAAIDAAVQAGLVAFAMDGSGFVCRWPMSDDDHRQNQESHWRSVVRDVEKALGEGGERSDATQRGMVQLLRDNDVAAVRRVGYTEFFVGTQGAPVNDYQWRGAKYEDNLLRALTTDEPRPPSVTQALIDKQFALFRGREARMPAAFAAARERALQHER